MSVELFMLTWCKNFYRCNLILVFLTIITYYCYVIIITPIPLKFCCSGIPDNYKVLFLQGGGTGEFAAVPLNLARGL